MPRLLGWLCRFLSSFEILGSLWASLTVPRFLSPQNEDKDSPYLTGSACVRKRADARSEALAGSRFAQRQPSPAGTGASSAQRSNRTSRSLGFLTCPRDYCHSPHGFIGKVTCANAQHIVGLQHMALLQCKQGLCILVLVSLTAVLRGQSGDPGARRPFKGLCEVKTIFLTALRPHLFVSLAFSSVCSFPEALVRESRTQ